MHDAHGHYCFHGEGGAVLEQDRARGRRHPNLFSISVYDIQPSVSLSSSSMKSAISFSVRNCTLSIAISNSRSRVQQKLNLSRDAPGLQGRLKGRWRHLILLLVAYPFMLSHDEIRRRPSGCLVCPIFLTCLSGLAAWRLGALAEYFSAASLSARENDPTDPLRLKTVRHVKCCQCCGRKLRAASDVTSNEEIPMSSIQAVPILPPQTWHARRSWPP